MVQLQGMDIAKTHSLAPMERKLFFNPALLSIAEKDDDFAYARPKRRLEHPLLSDKVREFQYPEDSE